MTEKFEEARAQGAAGENGQPVHVQARQIRPLLSVASAEGLDVKSLLRSLDIAEDLIAGDGVIALADYFRVQNQISAALGDETLHLSSRQLLPGTTDFVMSRLAGATSLLETMRILAQSYNLLHGGEFNSVRRKGDVVTFIIDDRRFPYTTTDNPAFLQFSLECVQIFLHCMIVVVSRPHAQAGLRRLSVRRAERSVSSLHLDFWRAPIRFGAPVYALDYDYEVATAPIEPPPLAMLNAAHVYAEIVSASAIVRSGDKARETSEFVRRSLAKGIVDQTRIAALAGVSVATLRRRLEGEGASFRDLRQLVLNEAAKDLLRRQSSVAEVAEELGFSDFRAFNRAFKCWNGVTPKAFADAQRRK
jgi:AraC-like DNA-binding protein